MINFRPSFSSIAHAEEAENEVYDELVSETGKIFDDVDFSGLEEELANLEYDFNLFNGKTFKSFVSDLINGKETLDISSFLSLLGSGLKEGIRNLISPLVTILVVVLLCTLFNNIRSSKISGVGEVIYFICFAVITIILTAMLARLINQSRLSLTRLNNQMNAIFPILISLMAVMGGSVSVQAYSPMLAFLSGAVSNIFIYVLLPLFSFSLVISLVGNMSENTKLGKLNSFIGSLFKWILTATLTIFMSFLTLKGIVAGSSDGISIKAAKFAIKNYVPFLGGYISDGFELIKAGGLIVKNATGFAGIVLLLATILVPLISIALLELGLKLLAGIVEPIGDKKSANLLSDIAKSLRLLVAILVGVALMYFVTIFLITCSLSSII